MPQAEEMEQVEYLANGTVQSVSQLFGATPHSEMGSYEQKLMLWLESQYRQGPGLTVQLYTAAERDSCPLTRISSRLA